MYLRCAVLLDRLLTCLSFPLLYSSSFIRSSPFHFRSSLSSLWLRPYLALARLLSTLPLTPPPPPSLSVLFLSLSLCFSISLFLSFSSPISFSVYVLCLSSTGYASVSPCPSLPSFSHRSSSVPLSLSFPLTLS